MAGEWYNLNLLTIQRAETIKGLRQEVALDSLRNLKQIAIADSLSVAVVDGDKIAKNLDSQNGVLKHQILKWKALFGGSLVLTIVVIVIAL